MSSPLSAIEVSVKELLRQAKQLGLVWGFRAATVIKTSAAYNQIDCSSRYDGDILDVPTSSLVGAVVENERVMVLYVPPNGNYIVGRLNPHPKILAITQVTTAGTYYSGTGEASLSPAVSVRGDIKAGRIYKISYVGPVRSAAGATEPFVVKMRIRANTAAVVVQAQQVEIPSDAFQMSSVFHGLYVPTVDTDETFEMTAQRTAGGGANAEVLVAADNTHIVMMLEDATPDNPLEFEVI